MIDRAASKTDKRLEEIEKRLHKIYEQAQDDLTKSWKNYMEAQNAYVKDLQEAYGRAKDFGTPEEVREIGKELGVAKAERTLQNQYYKDMVKETTRKLANVNQTALNYVNGQMFWVYSTNYNQAAKDADKVGFRFDMVDEATVRRRVIDGDILLPRKKINIPKDQRWNTKQLNSSVLQGIVNGESMQKIADRILPVVNNNTSAAIRNARTMVTGAQNQGRQDSYGMMNKMGIVLKKVWMATPDERTRESHLKMDGEEVEYDKEFSNGLMFPGDPGGRPEEVYNCRCTMVTDIIGFRKADGRIEYVGETDSDDFHEQQIEEERARRETSEKEDDLMPDLQKLKGAMDKDSYDEYSEMLKQNEYVRTVYELYADQVNSVIKDTRGYYQPATKSVHFDYSKRAERNKYSTLAHEYGHAFDDLAKASFPGFTYNEAEAINKATNIYGWSRKTLKEAPSVSDQYLEALRKDKSILRELLRDQTNFEEVKKTAASAGVQDLADGLFSTQGYNSSVGHLPWGHGDKYYNRFYNQSLKSWGTEKQYRAAMKDLGFDVSNEAKAKALARNYETASELWANQISALTVGGDELKFMEKYAPTTLGVIKEALKGVKK